MAFTTYRADIDGLRAIAVLTVILFHFNSQWLPGGFIGVDVFFVISGYIITRIIYSEMNGGHFSFSQFYIKRIKRILPLFYLVSISSLLVSWFIFTPDDLVRLADSIRYASVFIANTYFEKNSGYFAPAAESMPLLHMWSLSVEEQFYFAWPLLLFLSVKFLSQAKRKWILVVVMLLLVALSEYAARTNAASAYYLIQYRGSELLVGALLSMLVHDRSGSLFAYESIISRLGMAGAAALVLLFILLDEETVFPGLNAFMVSVASAMIILNGELRKGLLYRLLSTRELALIGRLSFSLYLWHWPVLAIYRYSFNQIDLVGYFVCVLLILLLSYFSWRFVEKPFRYSKLGGGRVFLVYFVIPVSALVFVSKDIKNSQGYHERMSEGTRSLYESTMSTYDDTIKSPIADSRYEPFSLVPIGDVRRLPGPPSALLWGDSHAAHYRGFMDKFGKENLFYSLYGGADGCPPIIGVDILKHGSPEKNCSDKNKKIFEVIKDSDVSVVFLAGRWARYTETTPSEGERGDLIFLSGADDYSESVENTRRNFRKGMDYTIGILIENGKKPVLFEQVPSYPFDPGNCVIRKGMHSWMKNVSCEVERQSVDKRQLYANKVISEMERKYPELLVVRVNEFICNPSYCSSMVNGVPLYHDDDHINVAGSELLFGFYSKSEGYKKLQAVLGD
ncbi:acyltransferase family protein [Oceanimonas smirnovii]|uniref:Acyltransferase family protein n=1 Tax=Oceanimonas smirnovii TaxID=264574 RepID=A0ABW7NZX3_9GAMM